ncbi:MAG TPA: hypothetical protein VGK52_02675 [Polyangia bacterium]
MRKVGKHRRLRIEDVLSFKEKRRQGSACRFSELSQVTGGFWRI